MDVIEFIEIVEEDDDVIAAVLQNAAARENDDDGAPYLEVDMTSWRRLSNSSFKENFRMDRTCFENLLLAVGEYATDNGLMQRIRTPLDLKMMMGLWPIFNPDTFRSQQHHFGKPKSVIYEHYKFAVKVLKGLTPKFIKWPSDIERDTIKAHFERSYGYAGVVGCIDGVHIEITAPLEQPQRYVNRHHQHSVMVQAVCDHKLLYRDIYVGEAGCVGDRRMFERSELSNNLLLRDDMLHEDEHILGDGAYPLLNHLLIPYLDDGHLTRMQRHHNYHLSSCRAAIERSFALLRARERRLKKLQMRNHLRLIHHVAACFVLHNIILLGGHEARGIPSRPMAVAENAAQLDALTARSMARGALKREYMANLLRPAER